MFVHVCAQIHSEQYLSETEQQLMQLQETGVFGLQGDVERVAGVAELVAALHDESNGVVVSGWQLVSMKDDDLSSSHHFLVEPDTHTEHMFGTTGCLAHEAN